MIPQHLASALRQHADGDLDEDDTLRLYGDLIVDRVLDEPEVPQAVRDEIAERIEDGALSPAGDVLRYSGEGGEPMVYNHHRRLSEDDEQPAE